MNAIEIMRKARTALIRDHCFFGHLSMKLEMKEDASCPTAWTDGTSLGFSPAFIEKQRFTQVLFVFAHEVGHNLLGHTFRRENRDPKLWNVACDYVLNSMLIADGLNDPPDGALVCSAYEKMSADQVYAILEQNNPPEGQKKKSGGQSGAQSGSGSGSPDAESEPSDDQNSDPGGCGECRDAADENGKPAGAAEKSEMQSDWKVAISQAAAIARGSGQLGKGIERLVTTALMPDPDWKAGLHRFAHEQVAKTETWCPPDRRFVWQGVYKPGLGGTEVGHIVIAVDTSGSIFSSQRLIDQFACEVQAVRDELHCEMTVLYCDTKIRRADHFDKDDDIAIKPMGGGGTDFSPAFKWVEENMDMPPVFMIYLTDLEGTFPRVAPDYPVLWAVVGSEIDAPFGEVVKMK